MILETKYKVAVQEMVFAFYFANESNCPGCSVYILQHFDLIKLSRFYTILLEYLQLVFSVAFFETLMGVLQ